MKMASRLFAAFAWGAVSLALASEASANGGVITFSGALVNPSCQLNIAMAPGLNSAAQGTVNATLCGNTPSNFSTTLHVSRSTTTIGQGIAQISVQDSTAGPIMEVIYN